MRTSNRFGIRPCVMQINADGRVVPEVVPAPPASGGSVGGAGEFVL